MGEILLNGKKKPLTTTLSVDQLLTQLELNRAGVIVELNEMVIAQSAYQETLVCAGDQIEILQFVGGG